MLCFSLLGSEFGGDGKVTFALPDLRGRTPLGTEPLYKRGAKAGRSRIRPGMSNVSHFPGRG